MRIDHLELTNFRCFETLSLDLHPEFNVLVGENGVGKTAALEALAVAAGVWFDGIKSGGGIPRTVKTSDVRLIGRETNGSRRAAEFEAQYPVAIRARGAVTDLSTHIGWECIRRNAQPVTSFQGAHSLIRVAEDADRRVRSFEPVTLPVIAYHGAGRLWQPPRTKSEKGPLSQEALSRLEGYRDALEARASAVELTRWLEYQARVAFSEGEPSPTYRAVLEAMRRMLPGAADVRFDAKRLEVVVEWRDASIFPFRLLSDGQRNMLALAGDVGMRMARLNPDFESEALIRTPGIVLIDELDLHLHPRWQREVVRGLRETFPRVQFVTTTHSPQIVGTAPPDTVTVLQPQGTEKPAQSYGMDANFILQHVMGASEREPRIVRRLEQAGEWIEEERYDEAQDILDDLREELGEFEDLVRLQARIDRIRLLSQ